MNLLIKFILVIQTIENFHTAVLDRLGLLHGKVIYKTRKGLKFIARAGTEDIAEIAVVASGSEYFLEKLHLPKRPIVVDIGGHIGTFSVLIASTFGDNCRVIVFEPDKANYNLLVKNVLLNKIHSIKCDNLAISDYTGTGYLKVEKMNTDAYYLDSEVTKKPNVSVNTLQKALKKHKLSKVDLLKIDIEGGEYKMLGDKKTFQFMCKNVHYIFLEFHTIDNQHNSELIRNLIKGKFKIIHSHKSVYTLKNVQWK